MSYNTTYPSHSCVYTYNCINDPSSGDPLSAYTDKKLNEMLVEANKCFTPSGDTFNIVDSSNCRNIFYDLRNVALDSKTINDASYQNLLGLINQVDNELKILRHDEDPALKKGIEEKQRDLNKTLLMNIMWTTLAVSTLYYVFRKI